MKNAFLALSVIATLASCQQVPSTQHRPSPVRASRGALCLDTTYLYSEQAARTYTFTTHLIVGTHKAVTVPLRLEWETVLDNGCPQVAALRVYQLRPDSDQARVQVKTWRQAGCKPGPLAGGPQHAATGAVYLNLLCRVPAAHAFSGYRFSLNALGYHDPLEQTITPEGPARPLQLSAQAEPKGQLR